MLFDQIKEFITDQIHDHWVKFLIGIAFACVAMPMALSSYLNSRLVMRFGMRRLAHIAALGFTALATLHAVHALFAPESLAVFLALFQMLWIPWSTGETTYFSIGGYLPWSDASWWFNGGLRLLLDGKLNGLSATRIVNEVFFAALLGISGIGMTIVKRYGQQIYRIVKDNSG